MRGCSVNIMHEENGDVPQAERMGVTMARLIRRLPHDRITLRDCLSLQAVPPEAHRRISPGGQINAVTVSEDTRPVPSSCS